MTTTSLPRIPTDTSLERAIIAFNAAMDELDYQLGGFLDYRNISRFANFSVNKDDLKHQSGVVGISGAEPSNPNAIRFYAGDDIDGNPNFKVTQAGIMTAVAGAFLSSMGYPRITFNESSDNLLKASLNANNYVEISPTSGGSPGIDWYASGVLSAVIMASTALTTIATFNGGQLLLQSSANMSLNSGGNINLAPSGSFTMNGNAGLNLTLLTVKDVVAGDPIYGTNTYTKGILTAIS